MTLRASSVSVALVPLLSGRRRRGIALGHGHVLVDDGLVVSITPPGRPRMPNGIECDLPLRRGDPIDVGDRRVGPFDLDGVPPWDPTPRPRVSLRVRGDMTIDPRSLAGRGPGLTPAGDDVLCGYVAGLVLFHARRAIAARVVEAAAARTTALSATLLRHAARGELPEPAHVLLERGDAAPILAWGRSSGRCLAYGLALAFNDPHHRRVREGTEVSSEHIAA